MLAAVPGALYAHYVSYIDPTSFTIHESIFVLSIIIIVGGMGNLWGSLVAAAFMILVPNGHDNCVGYARFPHLNPLPEGEETNERLREFYDNALRFVGLPSGIAANVRQMLYGAALILVIWLQQTKVRSSVNNLPEQQAKTLRT